MNRLSHPVSFRLDERCAKLLEGRGTLLGMSPHQAARTLIEECLNQNENALLDGLNLLAKTISTMGEDVITRIEDLGQGQADLHEEVSKLRTEFREEMAKLRVSIRADLEKVAAAISLRK